MKYIELSQGKRTVIDDEDYISVSQYNWYFNAGYARRTYRIDGKRRWQSLHRFLMEPYGSLEVDHINGDTLDNRKTNLRLATHKQNSCNRRTQKNNKAGARGVCWAKEQRKWKSFIRNNGKRMHLGYFDNLEDAKMAYYTAAKRYHKEFYSIR